MSKRTVRIVIGVLVVAALVVIGVLLTRGDEQKPAAVTVPVETLEHGQTVDKTIVVPKVAVDQAARGLSGDAKAVPLSSESADHTDQRDETPPKVPDAAIDANARALEHNRRTTQALPTAGASGGVPGCVTSFVRNQSSRRGVRPTIQVLHYTVSPNRPGRSDVNGIVAFFNRSSSQASSHFVIDAEGNCAYIVPIEAKAWTQAGGNPWAVSYEIIATGREKSYLEPKGYAKLRSVTAWVARRIGSPLRKGTISGCAPSRTGIVQHADGGVCWGGHHDVGPFVFSSILAHITAPAAKPVTAANRRTCAKINAWRRAGRPRGGDWERNSKTRIANLKKRGVTCGTKGATRS